MRLLVAATARAWQLDRLRARFAPSKRLVVLAAGAASVITAGTMAATVAMAGAGPRAAEPADVPEAVHIAAVAQSTSSATVTPTAPTPSSTSTPTSTAASTGASTTTDPKAPSPVRALVGAPPRAQAAAEEPVPLAAAAFARPAQGVITSGFGPRGGGFHYGIDIANALGTPEYAVAAGTVISAGPASGFGLWVRIQHDDGTITVYGHMNTILVSVGQRVRAGTQIATMGSRGESSGPHLHFEVLPDGATRVDPLPWLAQRGITY